VLRRPLPNAVAVRVEGEFRLLSERVKPSARPASEQTLIDGLTRTFASPEYQPPLLPAAALEMLTLARDPNVSFGKIVALLESEPLIAARVLRIAQSPFYAGGARVQTIDDAVMRLGIRTIALVFTEAATNAQVFTSEVFRAPMQALRRHSTVTAHLARRLAERIGQPGDRIYVCGLLHDIGIAACLLVAPTLRDTDGRGFTFDQLKQPIYAVHEAAADAIAGLWSLPEGLRWVIAHHHAFSKGGHVSPIAALVCLGSWIASQVDAGIIIGDDTQQALAAARYFGWEDDMSGLVTLGHKVVQQLGGSES
jgi:HD-like signal output (HDOD) protein